MVTFTINKHIGVIAEHENGWTKELNVVTWNNNVPKYDIRDWSPEHDRMSRGLTLTEEELTALGELIKETV